MAEYILKDRHGNSKTFDKETFYVRGVDGELMPFTHGTGNPVLQPLEITENGTYTAPDGVDGYNPVTVNVDPTKVTILREQDISGFALDADLGYIKVDAEPTYELNEGEEYYVVWEGETHKTTALKADTFLGTVVFIGNGTLLDLPGNNEPFAIGYADGLMMYLAFTDPSETHTVGIWQKVKQSSGGGLPAGAYWQEDEVSMPGSYAQTLFMYNGILHCIARVDLTGAKDNGTVYRRENDAWVKVSDIDNAYYVSLEHYALEYNGKLHFAGSYKKHFVYDGTGVFTQLNGLPDEGYTGHYGLFVQDGKLKFLSYSTNSVYIWDEASDTWELEASQLFGGNNKFYVYSVNGIIYFTSEISTTEHKNTNLKIWKYENGASTFLYDTGARFAFIGYARTGKYIYGTSGEPNKGYTALAKFNLETGEIIYLGRYPQITSSQLAPVRLYGVDRLRLFGINSKSAQYNLILHEVTE